MLREFRLPDQPPSIAWIQQYVLRDAHRIQRHGIFFGSTFLPEIMQWVSELLGRPSLHPDDYPVSPAFRNPAWPVFSWHKEKRLWPDGNETTEWFADITFADEASLAAFTARWSERLKGFEGQG